MVLKVKGCNGVLRHRMNPNAWSGYLGRANSEIASLTVRAIKM